MTSSAGPGPATSASDAFPSPRRRFLIVVALTGFAISQPLLSVLGGDPATLAHHGIHGAQLVALGCLIAFVPAVVLATGGLVANMVDERLGRAVHLALSGFLAGCLAIQVAKSAGFAQPILLLAIAAELGVAFAMVHVRVRAVALWCSYAAFLPVLAAVFFIFASPASALLESALTGPVRQEAQGAARAPVVFIVLDELPIRTLMNGSGELDRTRFPNLATFADDATWYRHNTTLATYTPAAMPSLLTGKLPTTDGPLWTSHPDSLFTLLAPTHELEVFETVTAMCPYTTCAPTSTDDEGNETSLDDVGPGFGDMLGVATDLWFDRVRPGAYETSALDDFAETFDDAEVIPGTRPTTSDGLSDGGALATSEDDAIQSTAVRAEQFIESFDTSDPSSLYYLHLMLPHQPWARQPDGELYRVADPLGLALQPADRDLGWAYSDWIGTVSEQRHTLQAQFADRLVGRVMDALDAEGLYDESLVVVMSDHGISFETGSDPRTVSRSTVDAIAYSPLFIKAPGQADGIVDDSNLMTIDVVPTVAQLLGLTLDWDADGAPAGSAAIAARGDAKRIYRHSGLTKLTLEQIIEFSDREAFATVSDSPLGELSTPDDPLAPLNALLGIDAVVGRPLSELVVGQGGTAQIETLDELTGPTVGRPRFGMATGWVPDGPDDAVLLLAVNGTVVGGSRLSTTPDGRHGRFAVLLPQGSLKEDSNEIRAAVLVEGVVRELTVENQAL